MSSFLSNILNRHTGDFHPVMPRERGIFEPDRSPRDPIFPEELDEAPAVGEFSARKEAREYSLRKEKSYLAPVQSEESRQHQETINNETTALPRQVPEPPDSPVRQLRLVPAPARQTRLTFPPLNPGTDPEEEEEQRPVIFPPRQPARHYSEFSGQEVPFFRPIGVLEPMPGISGFLQQLIPERDQVLPPLPFVSTSGEALPAEEKAVKHHAILQPVLPRKMLPLTVFQSGKDGPGSVTLPRDENAPVGRTDTAPVIKIHIGRIEVKAVSSGSDNQRRQRKETKGPELSLEEFLNRGFNKQP